MLTKTELDVIQEVFVCKREDIKNIRPLKKGMTNVSYLFEINNETFMIRTPGHGTEHLISRKQEYEVYQAIAQLNIAEKVVYLSYESGYKITKFFKNANVCDFSKIEDVEKCISVLRAFHDEDVVVGHTFDLFERIKFYGSLYTAPSYPDYKKVRDNVFRLKAYINQLKVEYKLTHIDPNPDNFLIIQDENDGQEKIRLIDWEYAAMQDPHVDIAMFCIYVGYNRTQIDRVIDIYFNQRCPRETKIKIYAYISICGLLWSNWCEYKKSLGVEFGEYALQQYNYAREYYKIVQDYGVLDE